MHKEVLQTLYCTDEIKENEVGGHVARMREMRNAYTLLVEKPERKIPLTQAWRRWEDNIKIYFVVHEVTL
jgi:hypothetical protein